MLRSSPVLSIIIPSLGRQRRLNELLLEFEKQAIAASSEKKIEIIIVDDGSEPPLEKRTLNCPSLWLRLEHNSGAPAARKHGFRHSSGHFIHFHDSDDFIKEDWLSNALKRLSNNAETGIFFSPRIVTNETGSEFREPKLVQRNINNPEKLAHLLKFNNIIGPIGGVIFSRKTVNSIRFNNLAACQDWDMYLDALQGNVKAIYDASIVLIKNDDSEQRISRSVNKKVSGILKMARIHGISSRKYSLIRLFYIHSIKKDVNLETRKILDDFYGKNKAKILLSYFVVEARKFFIRHTT